MSDVEIGRERKRGKGGGFISRKIG